MNNEQRMVEEFHAAFDILISKTPILPSNEVKKLRVNLIQEEFDEFKAALGNDDMVEIADGLADILYVIYGAAVSIGLDLEPLFAEVHRSNMTKVGGRRRSDGKWEKPPTYSKAMLTEIIAEQSSQ